MKKTILKEAVLLTIATILKMILVEGSYAINFINFSYHKARFLPFNPFWVLIIYFLIHLGFYLLLLVINAFTNIDDNRIIFIFSCIMTLFELVTYNINNKTVDIVSGTDLLLINIIVTYFIFKSQTYYRKEQTLISGQRDINR